MTFPILPSNSAVGGYQVQRSLRFNSADSAYLNRTPSVAGNRRTWTWSGWVKRSDATSSAPYQRLFECTIDNLTDKVFLIFDVAGVSLDFGAAVPGAAYGRLTTTQVFRDLSAWYHIVAVYDTTNTTATDRMRLYVNGIRITEFSAQTNPDLNSEGAINSTTAIYQGISPFLVRPLSGYLTEVNFIDGQALTPTSFGETNATTGQWQPKRYTGTYGTNGFYLPFSDNSSVTALGYDLAPGKNLFSYSEQFDNAYWVKSNVTITANATTAPDSTSTADKFIASATTSTHSIYSQSIPSGQTYTFSIYAKKAEYDRLVLNYYGISFDLTNGIVESTLPWQYNASAAISSVGNGWYRCSVVTTASGNLYLSLASSAQTGNLSAPPSFTGNGTSGIYIWGAQLEIGGLTTYKQTVATSQQNNWTPNNFSVTPGAGNDSMIDVPTNWADGGNGRGNYCTLNPLDKNTNIALANGNLDVSLVSATNLWYAVRSTIGVTSGKWYFEATLTATNYFGIGFYNAATALHGGYNDIYSTTSGAVLACAFDADAGTVTTYLNNVAQSTVTGKTSGPYFPYVSVYGTASGVLNFGQRPFAYTPPSGFKALNTQNLPSPTIAKGNTQFNPVLYTGDSNASTVISGVGFQPDFVWIKNRSKGTSGEGSHMLFDVIRGVQKTLQSDLTAAEQTQSNFLTAFNADGFTPGTATRTNENGSVYVAWNWKANGTGVTNTAGSITSIVSANTTAGFSVVTYTGTGANATVGHGLGVAPRMVIVKSRTQGTTGYTGNWAVWHTAIANTEYLLLNTTDAKATGANYWNSTTPTSSVFSIGTAGLVNTNTHNFVAYCFAAIPGYSAFGSYTGNGSADGPFVYTGFRPAYVLIKMSSSTGNWVALDKSRLGYNVDNNPLYPNLADAEATTDLIDILSNGFKIRSTDASVNTSSGTYIYAAFAESPFKFANAR